MPVLPLQRRDAGRNLAAQGLAAIALPSMMRRPSHACSAFAPQPSLPRRASISAPSLAGIAADLERLDARLAARRHRDAALCNAQPLRHHPLDSPVRLALVGAARTLIASAEPCGVSVRPSTPSRADLGVTRTSILRPAVRRLAKGWPGACGGHHTSSLAMLGSTTDLHERAQQDQHDRRDVDATEVGHPTADRPQQRLGHGIEPLPDASARTGCRD